MNKSSLFVTFMIFCWFACIVAVVVLHAQELSWLVISIDISLLSFSIILTAFYAGSETSLVSANRVRMGVLAGDGDKQAAIVKRLLDAPDRMLGMTLVGTNIMMVTVGHAGAILTGYVLILVTDSHRIQELVNTFIISVLVLIFCEILPKTIFRAKADALSLRFAYALRVSTFIFHFIVSLTTKLTNLIVAIASRGADEETETAMREELRLLATMGAQEGIIEQEQRRMIHSVLDLQSRTVEKVMVPLVDIVAVEKNSSVEELYQIAAEKNFSRIPIYDGRIYNIIGLVNILDVLYSESDFRLRRRETSFGCSDESPIRGRPSADRARKTANKDQETDSPDSLSSDKSAPMARDPERFGNKTANKDSENGFPPSTPRTQGEVVNHEDISPYIRQDIQFVPESKRVDTLLRELQQSHKPMAFVVDEYGGVIGLVTIKDLVEEIVGQIQDEYDEEGYIYKISDRDIECDGRMEILELNHRFGTDIPPGEYETIAGYVIYLMAKIPKTGEYIDTDELRILVLDADARSIHKIRIRNKSSTFI